MTTLHDFKLNAIDGTPRDLSEFKGKAVLVVNVASHCGFTPQYAGLQKLADDYADRGLAVLGVPANEFGAQEPGSNAQIKEFCETKFHVNFPMAEKQVVKGEGQSGLYQWLTSSASPPGDVKWNFEKFLVNRDGVVVGRFGSKVAPDAPELHAAIEAALA